MSRFAFSISILKLKQWYTYHKSYSSQVNCQVSFVYIVPSHIISYIIQLLYEQVWITLLKLQRPNNSHASKHMVMIKFLITGRNLEQDLPEAYIQVLYKYLC